MDFNPDFFKKELDPTVFWGICIATGVVILLVLFYIFK
jgi:hypothetical protein